MKNLSNFLEEYIKHTALNLGQTLQGLRYIYSHPDCDRIAERGSFKHFTHSVILRTKRVINDLFFAVTPPHWHHSKEELQSFYGISIKRWFLYGYCAWRFSETGEEKLLTGNEDRRWDPRCLS